MRARLAPCSSRDRRPGRETGYPLTGGAILRTRETVQCDCLNIGAAEKQIKKKPACIAGLKAPDAWGIAPGFLQRLPSTESLSWGNLFAATRRMSGGHMRAAGCARGDLHARLRRFDGLRGGPVESAVPGTRRADH